MSEAVRYFVLIQDEQDEFFSGVEEYIAAGWILQGGVCSFRDEGTLLFMQAMTKIPT